VAASLITTVCNYAIAQGIIATGTASLITGVFAFLKKVSKFFIVMAMGAIGLNTDLVKLVKSVGKPIFMGFCCWIAIALVSLTMQHILGIL
jgi:uncharacterized membrane protein YadS